MKEWILAISVEKDMDRTLPLDKNGNFESSLTGADGTTYPPCIISGSIDVFENKISKLFLKFKISNETLNLKNFT